MAAYKSWWLSSHLLHLKVSAIRCCYRGKDASFLVPILKIFYTLLLFVANRWSIRDTICRRSQADGSKIYFIANRGNKRWKPGCLYITQANVAVLYNPMTGQSGISQSRKMQGIYWSLFVNWISMKVFLFRLHQKAVHGRTISLYSFNWWSSEIHGPWTLSFNEGGPTLPWPSDEWVKMWTALEETTVQYFSGTASYTVSFKRPAEPSSLYLLNLGQVAESAWCIHEW